ncbi:hypothetical protein ACIQZB_31920 [Streptomyces sp. NPDC097727]|uniref:hypothetical protein n=1 Tax=Streptomyces sp. NPDC097727 TaxID=3366092 RepID=UPI0038230D95
MDVTSHPWLEGEQVLLATWPGLNGDWSDIVRPTVAEVRELHAALRLATVVLGRLSDTSPAGTEGTGKPDRFPGVCVEDGCDLSAALLGVGKTAGHPVTFRKGCLASSGK